MATLEMTGITSLCNGISSLAKDFPSVGKAILNAEVEVMENQLKQSLSQSGLIRTGRLRDAVSGDVREYGSRLRSVVGPTGEHHKYSPSGKNPKADGIARSGHIGYIHNYGVPSRGIPAREWAEKAVEKGQGPAMDAAEKVYDEFLKKHDL